MSRGLTVILTIVLLLLTLAQGKAATSVLGPILSGSLANLDIKDAMIEPRRGVPKSVLTIGQHFALDPT